MSVELTLCEWNTHKVGMSAVVQITYLDVQLQLLPFDALWYTCTWYTMVLSQSTHNHIALLLYIN